MDNRKPDTVIVDNNRSNSYGWVIAIVVLIILVILFFAFGGSNLFNGSGANTVNVDTPDTVKVQPTN